ncbi:MAG: rane protein insertase YidC [Burkholderiales bacterium]|jgi:YidC/Oxa1 family membrane protein insertase|nr:rane protein insertase YidC [Burkholderiales bacterium]
MDTQRLVLLVIFSFSLLMLWEAWEKEKRPKPAATPPAAQQQSVPAPSKPAAAPTPSATPGEPAKPSSAAVPSSAARAKGETVRVRTDLLFAEIDTLGGTLKRLELLRHKDSADPTRNFVLFGPEHRYEAQSGITREGGPNHLTVWTASAGDVALEAGNDTVEVRLSGTGRDGVRAEKVYTFKRNSYVVDVALEVQNGGSESLAPYAYFQLTHDGKPTSNVNTVAETFGAQSFTGFAIYTAEKAFEKIHPSDLDKEKFERRAETGWLGFVQHYFVSAWIVPDSVVRDYGALKRNDGLYSGNVVVQPGTVAPGASAQVKVSLYAGPQEQRRLQAAAPGLDLVVDYGFLAIIAWPLFWLLEKFHLLSGNWGVAIILLTVLIKIVFFPLSAASYKSMAKMKLITPRLTKIREMYAHDRQKMNQAMMELYRTEKINPLGGCFPILVQIPVFIALYWVLLAAIELRHAPFMLWIKDLSALDPYYVLPILMSITMVLQTRMNPVPPDPVQARVMQVMPFVFSIFFFFFPAGLVLYWLVNNILSIAQQWQIQRMFNRDKPAHAKR